MFRNKPAALWAGAAAALSLAASAAPAPAAMMFDWSAPVRLSAAGQPAWTPDVAYGGTGSAVLAWGRYTGSDYVAQAVTRSSSGTLGQVRTISDPSTQPLYGPRVAADGSGNALLAWTRYDGSYFRVQARTLSASGELGDIETLSSFGQHASDPEVAVNSAGRGVLVWTRSDGDDYRVEARTMSTAGDVGDLTLVSDDGQEAREADVGIDGDGYAAIVWERYDSADDLILATTLEADGTVHAERTLSSTGGDAGSPRVAANEPGDVAFAWTREGRAQGRVDPAAGPLGGIKTLSAAGQDASAARVAIDGAADARFAWSRWDGSDWRVQSAWLPAGGTLDPVETLSDAGQNASNPQLSMGTGGTSLVAWSRWNGTINRVQVSRTPAGGMPVAVSTRSDAGVDAETPAVAVHSANRMLVAWEGYDGANNRIEYSAGSDVIDPIGEATPAGGLPTQPLQPVTRGAGRAGPALMSRAATSGGEVGGVDAANLGVWR